MFPVAVSTFPPAKFLVEVSHCADCLACGVAQPQRLYIFSQSNTVHAACTVHAITGPVGHAPCFILLAHHLKYISAGGVTCGTRHFDMLPAAWNRVPSTRCSALATCRIEHACTLGREPSAWCSDVPRLRSFASNRRTRMIRLRPQSSMELGWVLKHTAALVQRLRPRRLGCCRRRACSGLVQCRCCGACCTAHLT